MDNPPLERTDESFKPSAAQLEAHVRRAADGWGLDVGAELPGSSSGRVHEVRGTPDSAWAGQDLVLKVTWAHEESLDEAAGLRVWADAGAPVVPVREAVIEGAVAVLLLDRVRPGFTLASSSLSPDQEDEVVAQVLRRLWIEPGEGAPTFRPLAHMCSWWARQAEHRWADDLQGLPAEAVRTGLDLLASLPREWSGPQVLLATDLHHFNILSATEDPTTALADWRMIDPKPYVGDPHYDLTQHLLNDRDRLEADPESFARRMAELTGLDGDRAVRWLFARCVQESGVMDGALGTARALWPVVSRM